MGEGKWAVEWILHTIDTLGPPFNIYLESGVGQGALNPSNGNCHLHIPFKQVQACNWLTRHRVSMLS